MPWKDPQSPKHRKIILENKRLARQKAKEHGMCPSCQRRPSRDKPGSRCEECHSQQRNYYQRNREKIIAASLSNQKKNRTHRRQYLKQYARDVRAKVIAFLGGKCKRCGFSDPRALQIDHVNGGGVKELRAIGSSYTYYKKVTADKKKTYQLLCANCNWIKKAENEEHGGRRSI